MKPSKPRQFHLAKIFLNQGAFPAAPRPETGLSAPISQAYLRLAWESPLQSLARLQTGAFPAESAAHFLSLLYPFFNAPALPDRSAILHLTTEDADKHGSHEEIYHAPHKQHEPWLETSQMPEKFR
ncbi:MAG: hypothetical protein LBL19_00135 [Spirochaetaceae bacterium]|jgi:hypothetical protein|nr:hypothetical protein [Spirochaetaceae bacterium]